MHLQHAVCSMQYAVYSDVVYCTMMQYVLNFLRIISFLLVWDKEFKQFQKPIKLYVENVQISVPPIPSIGIGIIPIPIPVSVSVWYRYGFQYRYRYESLFSIGIGINLCLVSVLVSVWYRYQVYYL